MGGIYCGFGDLPYHQAWLALMSNLWPLEQTLVCAVNSPTSHLTYILFRGSIRSQSCQTGGPESYFPPRAFNVLITNSHVVGLERFVRLWQSLSMVLTSWPGLIAVAVPGWPASAHIIAAASLGQLQSRLGLARRWLRLFRFLDSLQISWNLYVSDTHKTIDTWFEIGGTTALGLYGLLETITLLDVVGVDHMQIFGPALTKELSRQAQMFWFIALYVSVLASGTRLLRIFSYKPAPATGSGAGAGAGAGSGAHDTPPEKPADGDQDLEPAGTRTEMLNRDRARLRGVLKKRREERRVWIRAVKRRAGTLGLKLLTDGLDMVIPAWTLGWLRIDPGLVGVVMASTSVLTSMVVWKRIGAEMAQRKG